MNYMFLFKENKLQNLETVEIHKPSKFKNNEACSGMVFKSSSIQFNVNKKVYS